MIPLLWYDSVCVDLIFFLLVMIHSDIDVDLLWSDYLMLGSVYGLSWSLSRTENFVIDIGYGPVFRCDYLFSWVVIGMEISMT